MKKLSTISIFLFLSSLQTVFAQFYVSVSTDLSLQRSFKKDQRFWAVGQNVIVDLHFTRTTAGYAAVCYYSPGSFKNQLVAQAKSLTTTPQQIVFTNYAEVRLKQISMGIKHYFVGKDNSELTWNVYGKAGFGLIFGKAINKYAVSIDTSLYQPPLQPVNADGHFKRLTFDLVLGWEVPIGSDVYFYTEAKGWIPTSEYPSKYLFVNNNAPFAAMISAGVRILFD